VAGPIRLIIRRVCMMTLRMLLRGTKTSPFGSALSFHGGADVDDPLRAAAILAISLALDATLSVTTKVA
jgi:hypothetical protein